MENLLSDDRKFERVALNNDAFINLVVNQEKRIDTFFKNLVDFNSMSKEMRKYTKPLGSILSPLQTRTYNLAKFLVPVLDPLTKNEYTVKDTFHFAEKICEQDPSLSICSLDVDSLSTSIPLDEAIDQLFENTDTIEDFTKSELKQLLCLATKESYFIFSGLLYKQIDGAAMGSPLGPSLAHVFLSYHEKLVKNLSASILTGFLPTLC